MKIRVRYAPSPTGHLHIGNARTALFNYLFAKANNGKFIIRIEDTDEIRNMKDGVELQLRKLKWLGISWDESIDKDGGFGPYSQMEKHKKGMYTPYIEKLLKEKKAYRCFCSSEELDKETKKQKENGEIPKYSGKCRSLGIDEINLKLKEEISNTVRIKVEEEIITWDDMVKGEIFFNTKDLTGDFNLLKRNGVPTYNFAVVIDDFEMKISHVLRGEDHISNTPKQILLNKALTFENPIFGHMTLIVNEKGKKLSKRDDSIMQNIGDYKNKGYIPEAMFNFISLLGFSPKGEEEIFSREEFIKIFDQKRLSKSPSTFDANKLSWVNNRYMKDLNEKAYLELVIPFLEKKYPDVDIDQFKKIAMLYKEQISYGEEIIESSSLFFLENINVKGEVMEFIKENISIEFLKTLFINLSQVLVWEIDEIKKVIKQTSEDTNIKGKSLFMSIRITITGQMHGPDLNSTISMISKEIVLKRIEKMIENL